MRIPEHTIEEIRSAGSIVDLISNYVELCSALLTNTYGDFFDIIDLIDLIDPSFSSQLP
jgi:hypothetical protein